MTKFSLFVSYVFMALIPLIVIALGYEVVMRYGFSRSSVWVHDFSIWAGAAVYLVSGIYAMARRSHISITVVYDILPRPVQRAFAFVSLLIVVVFAAALAWGAGPEAWRSLVNLERAGTSWNPPIPGTIKPLIILVFVLVALQAIANFVSDRRPAAKSTPIDTKTDAI